MIRGALRIAAIGAAFASIFARAKSVCAGIPVCASVALCASVVLSVTGCASVEQEPHVRWIVPPRVEPSGVRVETTVYELPLARAEALFRPALERDNVVGVTIDDPALAGELARLAREDAGVVRADRPPLELAPGERGRVPDAVAPDATSTAMGAARSDDPRPAAGEGLALDVTPTITWGWAPFELELVFAWVRAGQQVARFQGKTPIAEGRALRILCMPSRQQANRATNPVPVLVAFVRLVPVYTECAHGRLDAGEGVETERGALANVGASALEYELAGDGAFHAVALGASGRARFTANGARLRVSGGGESELRCTGEDNVVSVTGPSGDERPRVEFSGERNRIDVAPSERARD